MAILDLNAADTGERGLEDRPTIFAYLEDLQRSGAEVRLAVLGQPPLPATITRVLEEPPGFEARPCKPCPEAFAGGEGFELLFTLDGVRMVAPVRLLGPGTGADVSFSLPTTVRHAERRNKLRVHFGSWEKATVTALEGLMNARGATGPLLDLSPEGVCMGVDRAVTIRGHAPLEVEPGTFPIGTRFPILRIDQLPYSPVVVCAGVVPYATSAPGGVQIGIRFQGLGEMEAQVIRQVLGRRLPKFNRGFPERTREGNPARGTGADAHSGDSRKVAKRILVIVRDDLNRAILVSALRNDGYRAILEARTFAEALERVRLSSMDALILEDEADAFECLTRLRGQGFCESTPAVLLASHADVRTRVLAEAAQIEHVQALSEGFGAELKDVLEGLLGI